jgi:hypothetical protein
MPRQKGITLLALLLIVFATAMTYWIWRAHTQVSLEIALSCRVPAAEACAVGKARYVNNFYYSWF